MSVDYPMFLKVNIKGRGYVYIWSETPSIHIDEKTLDKALPLLDSSEDGTQIAYIANRWTSNLFLLVIGARWKNRTDEYKRAGLNFWYGVLIDVPQANHEALWNLSNSLLVMAQKIDIGYEEIGEILGDVARKKQESNWSSSFFRLLHDSKPLMKDFEKRLVLAFIKNKKKIKPRVNIKVLFPFHPKIAIPCMLSMLLFVPDIRRVGGGKLLISETNDVQIISSEDDINNYRSLEINYLFEPLFDFNALSAQVADESNKEHFSYSQMAVGIIIVLAIIICIVIYFAFRQFFM